ESLLGLAAAHWDHEPVWIVWSVRSPAFRRPGPAKAGTPNVRFMERSHGSTGCRSSQSRLQTSAPRPDTPSRAGVAALLRSAAAGAALLRNVPHAGANFQGVSNQGGLSV